MSSVSSTPAPTETTINGKSGDEGINWTRVDEAINSLELLDVVEMANHVLTQARIKGAKEAYNEAGSVRYQLSKIQQHVAYLQETICSESIEAQHDRIKALKKSNAQKRIITGQANE